MKTALYASDANWGAHPRRSGPRRPGRSRSRSGPDPAQWRTRRERRRARPRPTPRPPAPPRSPATRSSSASRWAAAGPRIGCGRATSRTSTSPSTPSTGPEAGRVHEPAPCAGPSLAHRNRGPYRRLFPALPTPRVPGHLPPACSSSRLRLLPLIRHGREGEPAGERFFATLSGVSRARKPTSIRWTR